jgi:outer membrane receptor for ferrienterochelin and colicin
VKSVGLTWQNVDKSHVSGIEIEGKKILPAHFDLRANVAFIKSETNFVRSRLDFPGGVKEYIPIDTLTRTMFGQAPYVVNGMLTYTADSLGLSVSVNYNVQGARLVITSDNPFIPDIYEKPRHLLDAKVIKSLGKHFSASLTVRDLLNTSIVREYKDTNVEFDRYTYGTNYILSVLYKL